MMDMGKDRLERDRRARRAARYDRAMWLLTAGALVLLLVVPFLALWELVTWWLAVRCAITGFFGWLLGAMILGATWGRSGR